MTAGTSALLVHGAGGGAWEWNVWVGVMRAYGFDVHAADLQPVAGAFAATTLDDYAAQIRSRLRSLSAPRVLVGASLGGLVAAMCASEADALILVNPVPGHPWHSQLPARKWTEVVAWRLTARLAGTRAALGDADAASALFAYRQWRDQPGAPLRSAWAGVDVAVPACPALLLVSSDDNELPSGISAAMACDWGASLLMLPASHTGPLLGEQAAGTARQAVAWLNRALPKARDSDPVRAPAH